MKWVLSVLTTLLLAFCLPGFAQSNSGTSNSTTNNSSQSASSSGQSDEHSGMSNQGSGSENRQQGNMKHSHSQQSMEGCIVRENTYYYLVPENGQRVRLDSSNSEVSKNEGHHVRIQGHESNGNSGSGNNSNMSNSSSGSSNMSNGGNSGASGNEQEVAVDKLQTISETCPANGNSNGGTQR